MSAVRLRDGLGAVLFDLDGTLVDSLPTIARAMAAACGQHGYEVDPDSVMPLIGAPMADLAGHVTGASRDVAEAINEAYLRIYHDQYIAETPPIEGATDLVQALHATGIPLGVVTNKNHAGGRRMVEVQGWQPYFDTIVGRDTTARPKPAPDPALHALSELGVEPARSALVGDTEFDMGCGRSADLARVIGIADSRSPQQLLEAGATDVVVNLAEVGRLLLDGVAAQ